MSSITYNKTFRNVNYYIQQNLQKCQLLHLTKPTEMSTITHNKTYRNVHYCIQQLTYNKIYKNVNTHTDSTKKMVCMF